MYIASIVTVVYMISLTAIRWLLDVSAAGRRKAFKIFIILSLALSAFSPRWLAPTAFAFMIIIFPFKILTSQKLSPSQRFAALSMYTSAITLLLANKFVFGILYNPGDVNYWLFDLMVDAGQPIIKALRYLVGRGDLEHALQQSIVAWSLFLNRYVFVAAIAFCIVFSYLEQLIFSVVKRERVLAPPLPIKLEFPSWLPMIFVVSAVLNFADIPHIAPFFKFIFFYVFNTIVVLYSIHAASLFLFLRSKVSLMRPMLLWYFIFALFAPWILALIPMAGLIENMAHIRGAFQHEEFVSISKHPQDDTAFEQMIHRFLNVQTLLPATILSVILAVFFGIIKPDIPAAQKTIKKVSPGKTLRKDMVRVTAGGKDFLMDIYEYPNVKGEMPIVGMTYDEASAACASTGKRLCGSDEWYLACATENNFRYIFGSTRKSRKLLMERCNVNRSSKAAMTPSGSFEKCETLYGLYDMVGNAWEWVESGDDGVYRLAGGYYNYKDSVSTNCTYRLKMLKGQIESIDRRDIGLRCCAAPSQSQ